MTPKNHQTPARIRPAAHLTHNHTRNTPIPDTPRETPMGTSFAPARIAPQKLPPLTARGRPRRECGRNVQLSRRGEG